MVIRTGEGTCGKDRGGNRCANRREGSWEVRIRSTDKGSDVVRRAGRGMCVNRREGKRRNKKGRWWWLGGGGVRIGRVGKGRQAARRAREVT